MAATYSDSDFVLLYIGGDQGMLLGSYLSTRDRQMMTFSPFSNLSEGTLLTYTSDDYRKVLKSRNLDITELPLISFFHFKSN